MKRLARATRAIPGLPTPPGFRRVAGNWVPCLTGRGARGRVLSARQSGRVLAASVVGGDPGQPFLSITTQPSSTATSGEAFAQQPVIQLRNADGSADTTADVTVTVAKATGSGTLGGTLTAVTNASGVATFTNLQITGSGTHTLQFTASGYTAVTSTNVGVSVTATGEPLFNAGIHTSVYFEDFEAATQDSDILTGVAGTNYKIDQGGVIRLDATTGANGSSKSMRVDWTGGFGESDAWILRQWSALPSRQLDVFLSWYYKISPAGTNPKGTAGGNGHKMMIFDQNQNETTMRYVISFSGEGETEPGGAAGCAACIWCASDPWCNTGSGVWGISINNVVGNPWKAQSHQNLASAQQGGINDGNWHRITYHLRRETSLNAGDGYMGIWVDGVQVCDDDGGDVASPAFGKVFTGYSASDSPFDYLQYPTTVNSGWAGNVSDWYDEVRCYYLTP